MFARMRITKGGCSADPDRMKVVEVFPQPETKSQVQPLLGLCQQFSLWVPRHGPRNIEHEVAAEEGVRIDVDTRVRGRVHPDQSGADR